ncbi:MAG: GNAT family N-acetyltransferase [Methanosarcinaceae archaeon]|nr:GNAT family N-acetyltransferase [Methanosarcinaceae archaeon]
MIIKLFSTSMADEVKDLVLCVLKEHRFEYDPTKDFDLDDINIQYLQSGGVFYVGLVDGKIIGTSAVKIIDDNKCEIKRIYIRKEFRNMGFGRELLLKALGFAERNYSIAVLKTDAELTDAIQLYLKNGFSVVKEEEGIVYFKRSLHM